MIKNDKSKTIVKVKENKLKNKMDNLQATLAENVKIESSDMSKVKNDHPGPRNNVFV